jgi:hypothetical protein
MLQRGADKSVFERKPGPDSIRDGYPVRTKKTRQDQNVTGGLKMADRTDGERWQGAGPSKRARQERLKLALRENLKRRKFQTRERNKATAAPSNDHDACPHGELGKGDN